MDLAAHSETDATPTAGSQGAGLQGGRGCRAAPPRARHKSRNPRHRPRDITRPTRALMHILPP
eukprot:2174563-Prymnesium_polylepis.1